jgi:ribulose-bisphosphate carboxylase small chain
MEIRDYPSRMDDPASRRFEALSYLAPMDEARVKTQLDYVMRQDWDCVVEHVEPGRAGDSYWYMWKLPLFGERDVDEIMAEAEACRKANSGHHVRISAIDKTRQTMGFSLVVHRAHTT